MGNIYVDAFETRLQEVCDYGGVLISEGVVLCTDFNGVELGPKDVSLLERCPLLGPSIATCTYVS